MDRFNPVIKYYKGAKIMNDDHRVFIAKEDSIGHYPPEYPGDENYWWVLEDKEDKIEETKEPNNMDRGCKTAEKIFSNNIGREIVAQLICEGNDTRIFNGVLAGVYCNTFIIKTHSGAIEMFRYEDIRYLYCKTLANMGQEISFRVKDSDAPHHPHKLNFDEVK